MGADYSFGDRLSIHFICAFSDFLFDGIYLFKPDIRCRLNRPQGIVESHHPELVLDAYKIKIVLGRATYEKL